jgi:hypothetical protein
LTVSPYSKPEKIHMPKFKEFLSALGIAPKTLDQAKATIEGAKPALDSVAALFSAASLDLDAMLSAGPDSLKAHLDSLSANDALLATAQARVTELESNLTARAGELTAAQAAVTDLHAQLSAVGFNAKESKDIKADFSAHVAKESALLLAKDGRPPVKHESAKESDGKADTTGLTGLAKTQAAFQAKLPKK